MHVCVEDFNARVLGEAGRKSVALMEDRDPGLQHVFESLVVYRGVIVQLVLVGRRFHKMACQACDLQKRFILFINHQKICEYERHSPV